MFVSKINRVNKIKLIEYYLNNLTKPYLQVSIYKYKDFEDLNSSSSTY